MRPLPREALGLRAAELCEAPLQGGATDRGRPERCAPGGLFPVCEWKFRGRSAQAKARQRKVTIWARVHTVSGEKVVALVPLVMP